MSETQCRHFNGYKPCGKNSVCSRGACSHFESVQARVLIIHLEALGAVLRSTSLLPAIKRRYPKSKVTWVTKAPAQALLAGAGGVDRVLTTSAEDLLALSALEFDVALVIDKSLKAAGVLRQCKVNQVFGFRVNSSGAIVPANPEAHELWELGLSDHKKFFVNTKSEQQLVHESLALGPYTRDEYQTQFSFSEISQVMLRRQKWSPGGRKIIGINTGCSPALPAKKLTVEGHRKLIGEILADYRFRDMPIVLLGGTEDAARNEEIARGLPVILSPTYSGIRDGMMSVGACDVVFTGDSLGMHMAIALSKWVVAWFGPSCHQEIDLYGRGVKILTKAGCSPCWKRSCDKAVMCYDQIDFAEVRGALARGLKAPTKNDSVVTSAHGSASVLPNSLSR